MILYHFTCDHSIDKIRDAGGMLFPRLHPILGAAVVWMTFDPNASREQLGLSSHTLSCDRMEHRLEIPEPDLAVPWTSVRDRYRRGRLLEAARGTRPDLWYVSRLPQKTV